MLVGASYFAVGHASAILAGVAASRQMLLFWRWSAFIICGIIFGAHIAYEHYRICNRSRPTAWITSVAVAFGGLAFALAANVHELSSASDYRPRMLLALLTWPLLTGVAAFIVALVVASGLRVLAERRSK